MKHVSSKSFPASAQNSTVCNSMLTFMLRRAPSRATQELSRLYAFSHQWENIGRENWHCFLLNVLVEGICNW